MDIDEEDAVIVLDEEPVTQEAEQEQDSERKLYPNKYKDQPLSSEEIETRQRRLEREQRFGRDLHLLSSLQPPEPVRIDSYASVRPSALYVRSSAVCKMDTNAIMNWTNSFVMAATCLGVEWIDDASLVIVFASGQATLSAFSVLAIDLHAVDKVREAALAAADIYSPPDEQALQTLGQFHASRPLIEAAADPAEVIGWLRLALLSDKKQKGARQQSQFYQQTRRTSTRERRNSNAASEMERLDAELESYVDGEDRPRTPPRRPRRSSPSAARDRQLDALDRELDNVHDREDRPRSRTRRDSIDNSGRNSRLQQLDRDLDAYANDDIVTAIPAQEEIEDRPGQMRSDFIETSRKSNGTSNGGTLLARISGQSRRRGSPDRWQHDFLESSDTAAFSNRKVSRGFAPIESTETSGMRGWARANTTEQDNESAPLSAHFKQPAVERARAADLFDIPASDVPAKRGAMYGWDD